MVRGLRGALVRRRHPPGNALDGQAGAAAAAAARATRGRDRLRPADAGQARARAARGVRDGGRARAPGPGEQSLARRAPPAPRGARHRPDLAGPARRRAGQPRRGDPRRPIERPARLRSLGDEPPGVHVLRAGTWTCLCPHGHRCPRGDGERAGLASPDDDRPRRAGRPAGGLEQSALAGRARGGARYRPARPLGGPHREVLAAPAGRAAGAGRRVGRDLSADPADPGRRAASAATPAAGRGHRTCLRAGPDRRRAGADGTDQRARRPRGARRAGAAASLARRPAGRPPDCGRPLRAPRRAAGRSPSRTAVLSRSSARRSSSRSSGSGTAPWKLSARR